MPTETSTRSISTRRFEFESGKWSGRRSCGEPGVVSTRYGGVVTGSQAQYAKRLLTTHDERRACRLATRLGPRTPLRASLSRSEPEHALAEIHCQARIPQASRQLHARGDLCVHTLPCPLAKCSHKRTRVQTIRMRAAPCARPHPPITRPFAWDSEERRAIQNRSDAALCASAPG